MKQTTNYKFNKPELTDLPDITQLNQNFDTIDTELKAHDTEIEALDAALDGKAASSHSHAIGDLPLASVTEAKAGSIDTKVMTPAKAKESALAFGMAIKETNPITSTANDTPVKWGQLGAGTYYFTQTGCLIDQPNQYGFLINHNNGSEIFQLFKKQNSGSMYYRSGNASGWGETWTKCANNNDLGAYLPLAGGTMTGSIRSDCNAARATIQYSSGKGGQLWLFSPDNTTYKGGFLARTQSNSGDICDLMGTNDGNLTWNGKNIVRSVNNITADASGNVALTIGAQLTHSNGTIVLEDKDGKALDSVTLTVDTFVTTGTVIAFAGNSVPYGGWLLCNGATVSRSTYATLFGKIGTIYGAGDGSSTFNLPNLTDKFIQGSATAGTTKEAGMPEIYGSVAFRDLALADGCFAPVMIDNTNSAWTGYLQQYAVNFYASRSSSVYGASTTVQPPAVTMRYYIKY